MGLIAVDGGLAGELNTLTASWLNKRYVGLFQNDLEPIRTTSIAQVQPANFSGYAGLMLITGWTPATLLADRAVSAAAALSWTHDGGPNTNWIFGYYVVDLSGVLRWIERRPGAAVAMLESGNVYQVTPQFSLGSRFPNS